MNAEIDQTKKTAVVDRENFFAQQESALSNQGGATDMLIVEMEAMKIIANVSTAQPNLIVIIFGNKFNEKCACTYANIIGLSKNCNRCYHFNYIISFKSSLYV